MPLTGKAYYCNLTCRKKNKGSLALLMIQCDRSAVGCSFLRLQLIRVEEADRVALALVREAPTCWEAPILGWSP